MVRMSLLYSFLWAGLAFGGECRLEQAIDLEDKDPLKVKILLENAEFDQHPIFAEPRLYNPDTNDLKAYLFNIIYEKEPTQFVGSNIWVAGALDSIGFSFEYGGDFDFSGDVEESNHRRRYRTSYEMNYDDELPMAKTHLDFTVDRGKLVRYQITHPIFERVYEGSASYLAFTGKHQTLCLLSANLAP